MTVKGYIRALPAIIRRSEEERVFRIYVTDALALAYHIDIRYAELIPDPDRKPPPDPEEGRARIMKKLSE